MAKRTAVFRPSHYRPPAEGDREYDRRRTEQKPWRRWYWTNRWRKLAKTHLANEPLCRACLSRGEVMTATICDHIVPHRGDVNLFWKGARQSLCASCHSRGKQRDEQSADA